MTNPDYPANLPDKFWKNISLFFAKEGVNRLYFIKVPLRFFIMDGYR